MRGRPHSLTLYRRDGETSVATHYCPNGDQPRLTLSPASATKVLRFRKQRNSDSSSLGNSEAERISPTPYLQPHTIGYSATEGALICGTQAKGGIALADSSTTQPVP